MATKKNMDNSNKRFTTYSTLLKAFKNKENKTEIRPYVIIEGNLTRDVDLKAGQNSYYVFNSIGTNISSEKVFAQAKNKYNKNETYADNNFFNIKFFGKNAERISKFGTKGLKLVVWGNIEEETYKDTQGNTKKSITIIVDNFIPIFKNNNNVSESSKAEDSVPNSDQNNYYNESYYDETDVDDEDIPF